MAKDSRSVVLTDSDRLCGRCGTAVARDDDWLCPLCRDSLESNWRQLPGSTPASVSALARKKVTPDYSRHSG